LLSKEQRGRIKKNLREYSRAFDEEDAAEESNVSAELVALRKRLVDEWNAWRVLCKRDSVEERDQKHGKPQEPEEEKEEIEVWIDEVIDQAEELVAE